MSSSSPSPRVEHGPPQRPRAVVEALVRRAYAPKASLDQLLAALFPAFAEHVEAVSGQLWLRDAGTLVLGRNGHAFTLDWHQHAAPLADTEPTARGGGFDDAVRAAEWRAEPGYREGLPTASGQPRETVVPIAYAERPIGELRLVGGGDEASLRALASEFARVCAHFERRYHTQRWATQHLGQGLLLVGLHPSVVAIDDFVEKAAATSIPVLIEGEFGTEKTLTAAALHACGPRSRRGRFVEILFASSAGGENPTNLAEAVAEARGGTLFLHGVDEMPLPAQRLLLQEIHAARRLGEDDAARPRLVASTTMDLRAMAEGGRFSKALLAELDFLSLTLPPLRSRVEDIPAQLQHTLEKYGWRAADKASPALVEACRRHGWTDNLVELERTLTRLSVMTGSRPVERGDLLDHAPQVLGLGPDRGNAPPSRSAAPITTVDQWARHLAAGTVADADLERLHEGLQRAVQFVGAHSKEQITLSQLARHARVSSSHLSFLFRSALGTTFKELLGRVRIERARRQLVEEPRTRITEVCLEAGFLDLSHFEKLFRRVIGESPRQYRRRVLGHDRRDG